MKKYSSRGGRQERPKSGEASGDRSRSSTRSSSGSSSGAGSRPSSGSSSRSGGRFSDRSGSGRSGDRFSEKSGEKSGFRSNDSFRGRSGDRPGARSGDRFAERTFDRTGDRPRDGARDGARDGLREGFRDGFRERPRSSERDNWVYGLNPVLEVLRAGREVKAIYILAGRRDKLDEVSQAAAGRGVIVKKAETDFFDSKFPKGHQGIAAAVAPRQYATLDDIMAIPAQKNELPLFLILDLVEDPRNFGAILRVADAVGVHGVVIQSHRSATLTPEAVKASAGAAEYMPVAMVSNIKHAIKTMKDEGMLVVGAEAGSKNELWTTDLSVPLALVIGSEGKGLRRTVGEDCDIIVSMPMQGMVNSLNASVAAGVILFEVMRQRLNKKQH
ncbi:MAG: 23S rRNA (guanosine(2251)-2'-O)-methyltransferase RlmB [Thermodesulfovibrio sp.]|nr:23S rRNA (guanosine(2251)-2'-O)-methyltransferase RlmB [Thermodesulfovibrio sp.]